MAPCTPGVKGGELLAIACVSEMDDIGFSQLIDLQNMY